jgi:methyl-accepting chemotaxis protein
LADEHGALDLRITRRANEAWLRDVATDLRAGVVSRALDVLREGAVREFSTHDDARGALVRSWAEATRAGKSALLVASRNDDVRAMNELAREAVSEQIGEERVYSTDFGERTFGIGDVLVGRERAHGGVNDNVHTLAAHPDDGRLEVAAATEAQRLSALAKTLGIGLAVAALIFGLGIATVISRSISRSVGATTLAISEIVSEDIPALTLTLKRLAAGDLTGRFASSRAALKVIGSDEIGALVVTYNALAAALSEMANQYTTATDNLRDLISGVALTSKSLAAASDEASAAAQQSTAVNKICPIRRDGLLRRSESS